MSLNWLNLSKWKVWRRMSRSTLRFLHFVTNLVTNLFPFTNVCLTVECSTIQTSAEIASSRLSSTRFENIQKEKLKCMLIVHCLADSDVFAFFAFLLYSIHWILATSAPSKSLFESSWVFHPLFFYDWSSGELSSMKFSWKAGNCPLRETPPPNRLKSGHLLSKYWQKWVNGDLKFC